MNNFIRWKIERSIQRGEAELNRTFHPLTNEIIHTITGMENILFHITPTGAYAGFFLPGGVTDIMIQPTLIISAMCKVTPHKGRSEGHAEATSRGELASSYI